MRTIYYIAGSDGSGKTTFLSEIESILINKGKKTKHIWIRSPKILSKPLMAYCRLVGLTKYKTIDGIRYGKHLFYKSAFISKIFPVIQLIDFKIKWFFEKIKLGNDDVLFFDRFNLDTLADLMVDTHNMELHKTWIGKEFLKLTPNNSKIIVLYVDEEITRKRKRDTLYDDQLSYKIKVYKKLSSDLKIKLIDNNKNFNITKEEIIDYFLYEKSHCN